MPSALAPHGCRWCCWPCPFQDLAGLFYGLRFHRGSLAPLVKQNVLSRRPSKQGVLDIHALLLCPDPSRHLNDAYRTLGNLGKGGFGSVFRVRHLATSEERAVKVIRKPPDAGDLDRVLLEVALLIQLDHPNIMKFHEYFEDKNFVCLVTELCMGGNLGELNVQDNTMDEIRLLFRDVVGAVAYLHSKGIAHRDLKFQNCLLTAADHCHRPVAKLIDFGLSSVRRPGDASGRWMKEPVGTVAFVAPEVLSDTHYGPECDVWSIGIMLYIVLTDQHPFTDRAPAVSGVLVHAIKRGPMRLGPLDGASADSDARDLLLKLLRKDPHKRLDARTALAHRFIRGLADGNASPSAACQGRTPRISQLGMQSMMDRLCSFVHFTCFERAIMTLVAHEAQAREVEDLRAAFVALDADRAGYLSRREFRAAVSAKGIAPPEAELEAALQALDPDGDDKIEYTDWLAATLSPAAITKDTAMRELFNFFDIHGEGQVSKDDLRDVLGEDVAEEVLKRTHHENGNGGVSWQEFKVLIADVARHLESVGRRRPRLPG
uniref:non-specific serine/threonine protein kinase n=1 Tax=Alexandrium monilatum TaxID=311494 RepID=A0A7S4QNH5_9DINO|mmetsp:Transcript_111414/g.355532  ORF Transcript_111414/g.355532 Transcript_111414/m.355532 type:complete len:545 (+) Transcript_111414:89-1723(+)